MSKKRGCIINYSTNKPAQVVLIHGLGRTRRSMNRIAKALKKEGYTVFNFGYNGVFGQYPDVVQKLEYSINQQVEPDRPLHFVVHSLGGILLRSLLSRNPDWQMPPMRGRCVMLGTPNKGTQTASFMLSHFYLKLLTPPMAAELVPQSPLIKDLPEPEIETGVIAGNVNFHCLIPVSWYYKTATHGAEGDGVVEISNTRCRSMLDFIVMPLHHSFMTWDSSLIEEVIHFLARARFSERYRKIDDA